MRFFLKYFLLLLASVIALTVYIPLRYGLTYPQPAGPKFSNAVRTGHSMIIDKNKVNVVLVGDSTLERSVDETKLAAVIGQPAHIIFVPASGTAIWYLILKNAIIEGTKNKPRYFIIMFRDTLLTLPNFHVTGGRVAELDDYATAHEDFLIQRAYLNFMNPLEIFAEKYFPIYSSRQRITDSIEYYFRTLLPDLLLPCKGACVDRALAAVFYEIDKVDPNFSKDSLMSEETKLYTRQAMNFDAQLDRSFLPEIIRLTKENGIHLILAESRTLTYPTPDSQPGELVTYKRDLTAYLKQNNIPLLDFSFDPWLPPSYFADPLHMNAAGQAAFTQILGQALLPLLH